MLADIEAVLLANFKNRIVYCRDGNFNVSARLQITFIEYFKQLSIDALGYIHSYQKIYIGVITETKRKENDRLIISSHNKTKEICQIINKETSNLRQVTI